MAGFGRHFVAMLGCLILCTACAVAPQDQDRRQAVEEEIAAILSAPAGEGQEPELRRCISSADFRNFRVLDDRRILFEGRRDTLWLNTLRTRCLDLRHSRVLRMRSSFALGRICEMDSFAAGEWFTWPWYRRWPWAWGSMWSSGMTCSLGKFQAVTPEQVRAIEEIVDDT